MKYVVIAKVQIYKKNDTMSEFPVILQSVNCKLIFVQYAADFTPVLYYFLHTPHLKIGTSPPEMERKKERDQA